MLVRPQHCPVSRNTIGGQAIAKSQLAPRLRAYYAARWKLGVLDVEPTTKLAASAFRVSGPLVDAAIADLEPAVAERKNDAPVAMITELWAHLTETERDLFVRSNLLPVWDSVDRVTR